MAATGLLARSSRAKLLPPCVEMLRLRELHCSASVSSRQFNQPLSVEKMPRFAGIATMMRLPLEEGDPRGLDACFLGIPMDIGCSYRSGPRQAPRQIRHESASLRVFNMSTGAAPFESLQVADIGDVPVNPFDLQKTMDIITGFYRKVLAADCIPLAMGGDHLLSLPILRAMREKHGKMGLIQVDAHTDTTDSMLGERVTHSTPFRRAVEEGLLSPEHVVQIGLRGTTYGSADYDWPREQGFRMINAEDCWGISLKPLMESVRKQMGDIPVYFTFDIDGIDPAYCPGTGVREVGGLTVMQALEIVRGCKGLNMIGGDVVEVSPGYDPDGTTSVVAANLLFEMLCTLPGVLYKNQK